MQAKTEGVKPLKRNEPVGRRVLPGIRQVRIGLAGAGGLGSNCAAYLVRPVRRLRVVDFDRVSLPTSTGSLLQSRWAWKRSMRSGRICSD